jgi:hypothetical protein
MYAKQPEEFNNPLGVFPGNDSPRHRYCFVHYSLYHKQLEGCPANFCIPSLIAIEKRLGS